MCKILTCRVVCTKWKVFIARTFTAQITKNKTKKGTAFYSTDKINNNKKLHGLKALHLQHRSETPGNMQCPAVSRSPHPYMQIARLHTPLQHEWAVQSRPSHRSGTYLPSYRSWNMYIYMWTSILSARCVHGWLAHRMVGIYVDDNSQKKKTQQHDYIILKGIQILVCFLSDFFV